MTTRSTPTRNQALLSGGINPSADRTGHFQEFHLPTVGGTLVRLVSESIQDILEQERAMGCCGTSANDLPSTILLRLLTYSYAVGFYGSEEIEGQLPQDDALRYLTAEYRPRFDDLRQFRRRCRSQLRRCLTEALRRAAECGIELPTTAIATDPQLGLLKSRQNRWPAAGAATRFEIEADARIACAVLADCLALDE